MGTGSLGYRIADGMELDAARRKFLGANDGWAELADNGDLRYSVSGQAVVVVSAYTVPWARSGQSRVDQSSGVAALKAPVLRELDNGEMFTVVETITVTPENAILVNFNGKIFKFFGDIADYLFHPRRMVSSSNDDVRFIPASFKPLTPAEEAAAPASVKTPEARKSGTAFAGQLGSVIGSTIGNYLGGGSAAKAIIYSSLLGEVGERLAVALSVGTLESAMPAATGGALNAFGTEVASRVGQAAIGSVSTWLSMELGEALGLKGFGQELLTTVGGTVTGQVINNVLSHVDIWNGFHPETTLNPDLSATTSPSQISGMLGSAIGSFLGAKLGAMVVSPQTQAGVALSSIGSALGSFAGVAFGQAYIGFAAFFAGGSISSSAWLLGNVLFPGIGAFVGFVLGALIGNLFGKKKPKVPTASAETVLQIPYARYELGTITVANNGNRELVTSMAATARDTLNGLIAMVAYTNTTAYVSNLNGASTTQAYGHDKNLATGQNEIYARINGVKTYFASADQAVEFGSLTAIRNTKIVGGDIFAKRVIAKSPAADLTSLTGDLQVASDYRFYASNRALVNGFITGAYATLTEAEQSYYAANKALIDKTQAQGTAALTTGELSTYNANKPTIDKIIGALENQALANPWIITLQRVSELGLDKWTPSDFYGGLQGFLGSFDLAGHNAAFENIKITDNGNWQVKISASGLIRAADQESNAAKVWRLYDAAMGRQADAGGLAYNVNALVAGYSLSAIAASFYTSGEFIARGAPALSDADYIEWLYVNVLRRPSDAVSKAAWLQILAGGRSRSDVLLSFSEAPEHKAIPAAALLVDEAGLDLFSILSTASTDGRSVTIDNFASVLGYASGYRYSNGTGAQGTSSGDLIWSANDGPMTLDDSHSELRWVPPNYHIPDDEGHYVSVTVDGGDDIFIGGSGNDTLYGRSGWDWLDGGAGDDVLDGGDQNDVLLGGAGRDKLVGGAGDDYLAGGDGDDNVPTSTSVGGLYGGAGNDTLVGGGGSDELRGEDGDDILIADFNDGAGDLLDGGAGSDQVSYERYASGVTIDLRNKQGGSWLPDGVVSYGDVLINIEGVRGSDYADTIIAGEAAAVLQGLGGDDIVAGWSADDILEGGAGADQLFGSAGADTASYAGSSAGVYVDLTTGEAFGGDAEGDVFDSIENLRGSKLADQLKGGAGLNRLEGLAGDDWLVATAGADIFDGGEGKDFVDYSEATSGVSLSLGGYTATALTTGYGSGGLAAGHSYVGVEGVVGSAYADTLYGGDGDQTFVGGAGNDSLAGGAGADTYVLNRGDGSDVVTEDANGWNTFSLGEDVKFSDLWIGASGGTGGYLDVGIRGTSDQIRMVSNFGAYPIAGNNKLKSIDLNGASQLDIGGLSYAMAGDDNANTALYGGANRSDLIFGYNGDDSIYGVQAGQSDQTGDVIVGGLGNDSLYTSGGDDQFAYDRGDGFDTITDAGGEDTLVFGATVAAEDVIYEVVGYDLYIGAKDATNTALTASQVADRVRIVAGGVKWIEQDPYNEPTGVSNIYTVEYVIAGGTSIDLRKLNINWNLQTYTNYDNYYPIALDLDGDGLSLSSVEGSSVVVKTAQGGVSKIAWVGPSDGFLAVDRDGDGAINKLSEISFVQDKPGATSDLEGLRTWDTNSDGVLDATDANFSKILLFVDANQNGRSSAKELRTLEQAGIKAINLGGTATGYTAGLTTESFVQNTISFVWADGRTGEGYDVALARRVLGSEGLYAGAYQAEWGAPDEDGTLGQLLNDPKTAAKAARIKAKKGLLDRIGASYAEVKAAAQIDFSDNDRVDAAIAKRWKKMDASQQAAWLSGQATGMDGQQNLAALRAISSGQALSTALAKGAQAGQDLVAHGLAQAGAQAGAQVSASASDGSGSGDQAAANGLGLDFGSVSDLGGLSASQPLDDVLSASAAIGQDQAWWRGETDGGLAGAGSLAALLASMDQGLGQPASGGLSAAADPALLQQQMLLRQAMAGFGGETGGSAAVWNRDMTRASATLAASGQTTPSSAFSPALVS
jgi:Ca2+-binding RTX toxin-like protein